MVFLKSLKLFFECHFSCSKVSLKFGSRAALLNTAYDYRKFAFWSDNIAAIWGRARGARGNGQVDIGM